MKNTWGAYVLSLIGSESQKAAAAKVDIAESTLGRWITGAVDPKPRQVVAFARAYGQSPLTALLSAGYLADDEIDIPVQMPATRVEDLDAEAIAAELLRRIRVQKKAMRRPKLPLSDAEGSVTSISSSKNVPEDAESDDTEVELGSLGYLTELPTAAKRGRKKADEPHAD